MKRIRVLIVDDSALTRSILEKGLEASGDIEVVGKAGDAYVARDKIVFLEPDVVTLDVEMPRMDGVEFLKRLMPQHPVPVIMVSALTGAHARITLEALDCGAVDFVTKPSGRINTNLAGMLTELVEKIKAASRVDVSGWKKERVLSPPEPAKFPAVIERSTDKVIAIGASTGGTVAIKTILSGFPQDVPGTIVVQHMPPEFTRLFAERLDGELKVAVREAKDGDRLVKGLVLIAPGGLQSVIERSGGQYIVRCKPGDKENGHCPSVGVLFDSVAKHAGSNSVGVLLTGMGRDGAEGLLRMRLAGARTIAQDEKTSVVFGMPKEAFLLGAVHRLSPVESIAALVASSVADMSREEHADVD